MAFKENNMLWEKSKCNLKHGLRHKRIYTVWRSMRQRCNNPNCKSYKYYGGRGISVCREWDDPKVFAEWAFANGYSDSLTLDRIDVNKGYAPDNCRWVSQKAQQNNKTTNIRYEYLGEAHTLGEWADITGIRVTTLWARIKVRGWSVKDALTIGVNERDTRFKRGEQHGKRNSI